LELREVGGEVVLVHEGRLLAANRVATRVWDLLADPRTDEELCHALAAEWPEDPVDRDLGPFLEHLAELGLVSRR